MTRLDRFIDRMVAQRDYLNQVAGMLSAPGPILELGLGNGRTYDHLRHLFPDRRILVFDREVASHPESTPPAEDMILGDFRSTIPALAERIGATAQLAHADIGSASAEATARLAALVGPMLDLLLAPGAYVVSDQPMAVPRWRPISLPTGASPGTGHVWQVEG